jgi:hypothetical protein
MGGITAELLKDRVLELPPRGVLQFSWESSRLGLGPKLPLGTALPRSPLRHQSQTPCGTRSPLTPSPSPARGEGGRVSTSEARARGNRRRAPQGAACKSPPLSPRGRGVGGEGHWAPSHLASVPSSRLGPHFPEAPLRSKANRTRSLVGGVTCPRLGVGMFCCSSHAHAKFESRERPRHPTAAPGSTKLNQSSLPIAGERM